jgi:putative membrane protein
MSSFTLSLRTLILILLGSYLFVYPFGILLIALDIVPTWGTWMGGALLIAQGSMMGLWLLANYRWRGLLAALCIVVLSWAVEHVGVTTGFPFGGYYYTDALNLKIFGVVPLAVPFAWLLVVPAALGITEHLLNRQSEATDRTLVSLWRTTAEKADSPRLSVRLAAFWQVLLYGPVQAAEAHSHQQEDTAPITLGELAHNLWLALVKVLGAASFALLLDLMIEPLAVHINGYWVWDTNTVGGYYGVPGSNFVAWWVTSAVLALLLVALIGTLMRTSGGASPVEPAHTATYPWLPHMLYMLNLMMFALIVLAHGKLLAFAVGGFILVFLLLVRLEPWLVRWIMSAGRSTAAAPDQTGG